LARAVAAATPPDRCAPPCGSARPRRYRPAMYSELPEDGAEGVNQSVKTATLNVRMGFVRKVYSITAAQLLLTAAIAAPVSSNLTSMDPASVRSVLMFSSIMTLVTMISLVCCPKLARKAPQNYIILFTFTAFEGVLVGAICSTYSTQAVVAALLSTTIVVVGLTLYACTTKSDFTGCGPYLVAMLLALIGCQMVMWLACTLAPAACPPEMHKLFALAGVVIFSMYLVYDTQLILGEFGGHKQQFGIDDYVFAALNLYLDIINLFLYILSIFGDRR